MKIEVLMSACKVKKIDDVVKNKNINNCVIVNQLVNNNKIDKKNKITMYSYDEKGLSRSRNRLLEHMTGDIEIITDDDITFVKDYEKIVKKAYNDNPDADIITFNIKIGDRIIGSEKSFKYNKITILKVNSCQMTFKTKSIKDANIYFNENFGIGAKYISGEENIFLSDCLKNNLIIKHIPIIICEHPDEATSGEKWSKEEIITKGALSKKLYKCDLLYRLYMVITKYHLYKSEFSMKEFIKLYKKGRQEYK